MELEAASPVPRRDGRKLARCPRLQLDTKTVSAIQQSTGEAIIDAAAGEGGAGAMRVKVVLSKQQLKQVVTGGDGSFSLPPALEELVIVLKRQHAAKKQAADEEEVAAARRRGRWSPALQSIPEECFS
jgi:hypothetical protein